MSMHIAELLPDVGQLRRLCQSLAVLDAILQPEWEYRYFSFNCKWSDGQAMGSMRNGSGDAYFIVFKEAGAILLAQTPHSAIGAEVARRGSPLLGTFDGVPEAFRDAIVEPAFSPNEITLCLWRLSTDATWHRGRDADAPLGDFDDVLFALDGRPETYKKWADDYYERNVHLESVAAIYGHAPLTAKLVRSLNSRMTLTRLAEDLDEIGYGGTGSKRVTA